jgi:hypothetical protein
VGYVSAELAGKRVPDLAYREAESPKALSIAVAGDLWLTSRIDVAESTKTRNRVELDRITRLLGSVAVDELTPEQVATFVTDLVQASYSRGTIRLKRLLSGTAPCLMGAAIRPRRDAGPARRSHTSAGPPTRARGAASGRCVGRATTRPRGAHCRCR